MPKPKASSQGKMCVFNHSDRFCCFFATKLAGTLVLSDVQATFMPSYVMPHVDAASILNYKKIDPAISAKVIPNLSMPASWQVKCACGQFGLRPLTPLHPSTSSGRTGAVKEVSTASRTRLFISVTFDWIAELINSTAEIF